jgi:hypothetical protein
MTFGTVSADVIQGSVSSMSPNSSVFRNRIINGAMVIDQRNAGASVTPTGVAYTLDRWQATITQSSKLSFQQNAGSVTPPVGFTNYLGCTSLSAYSVGSGDTFIIDQNIEGYNIADLGWGTANAKTVTLSFWAYSSLTGTFGGSLRNGSANRAYPFSYSIPVANTWTQISITIAGDTTGTWGTTNGIGVTVGFNLGSGATFNGTAGAWTAGNITSATGATSVVGTSGATFYITGVQLEVGSSATGFEYRQYGQELALCQRYCPAFGTNNANQASYVGQSYDATASVIPIPFPVQARVSPTGVSVTGTFNSSTTNFGNGGTYSSVGWFQGTPNVGTLLCSGGSSYTVGAATVLVYKDATSKIIFTGCEL